MAVLGKKKVTDGIKLSGKSSVFYDLYVQQKRAIWFPEEIQVSQDLVDRNSMGSKEKTLFENLVGYFVTSELLVQNVLGESFYPYIIDPRVKQAMTIQMFMEDIHSDFFEIILNTFQMDRNKAYNMTSTHPLLLKKQERVAQAANNISISAGGAVDPDSTDGKKAILHAILLSSIIQEGIFFYSAFALFLAFREMGKMTNVSNGIDLVLIDESFHLKLGMELILAILEESPEIAQDIEFVNHIRQTIVDCTELELEFVKEQFAGNTINGLSYAEMEQYLKYITDRRLEELGLGAHYQIPDNPLRFLKKQDLTTLQNFFETTPINYTNF
ncbi:MAG TPA: ribonucleotide-diphosphate reductase subunit beta [Candidatus Absconditabacterales bacterium]|nr:ribonucleotide-diphosphate reductase subunit beta [Candidatus Absconditabacterales bacterium]HNG97412.1 ribonucleotide-diphosphate reductase subunit beta [Candidatus Absconditabacterales bacterium]